MKVNNPWSGYLERSYRQIKQSIITRMKTVTPEITDLSESNLLIIIVSIFSGLMETLHFYVDNWAREGFLSTARKFASVVKLTRILDYRIKSYIPASVDLYITYADQDNVPVDTQEQAIIPVGTVVRTTNGIAFVTTKTVIVEPGSSFGVAPAKQWERVEQELLGTTTNEPNQKYEIPGKYAHNSIELYVAGDPWILKDTLARSLPTDKHFVVDIDQDGIPYVQFGTGLRGAIPPDNQEVRADYNTTEGADGNLVSENTITELDSDLTIPFPADRILITNALQPIGGSNIEGIEDIRYNAPLTIRTLDRAVTRQDFKDIVLQADGVAKANIVYNCGVEIQVYIAPNGGGVADQTLLDETGQYLEDRKVIGRKLKMMAAGVTPVVVIAQIQSRFRVDKAQTKIDAENALGEQFSFENQEINGRVALSDVYAAIDNLPKVDTVDIIGLYTLPYPFPINHVTPLDWTRTTLSTSNVKAKWRLVWDGTNMRLFFNGAFLANVPLNVVYRDPKNLIEFKINQGNYTVSQTWEFTSYKYGATILLDDNTIPVIIPNQTTIITVN